MANEMVFAIDGRYIQDHFPGIGRYTFNLAISIAQLAPNEKFVVLCNPALKNTRYDLGVLARHRNLELVRVNSPTFSLREQFELPRKLASETQSRPSLFHSPYFIKPHFVSLPSVVTIFDLTAIHPATKLPSASARLFYRLAVWLAAHTAACILVPSLATCDDLVAQIGVPRNRVVVTPLAAEACFMPPASIDIERVRVKYNLPERYVLYVGINKPHKNLATLVHAVRMTQTNLVIAGAWDARYEVERDAKVTLIRDIKDADLPALYGGAMVFVMPSLYEGFGLPMLEAMACGAPVIASNVSSLPEVGGDAALYFDPPDTEALAALITSLASDRGLQDSLRAKSLKRAQHFSWDKTAQVTLDAYRIAAA